MDGMPHCSGYISLNIASEALCGPQSKEKDQIADRTKGDTVKSLIPLVDSFEAAQNSIKPETEGEKKISSAYQVCTSVLSLLCHPPQAPHRVHG